MSKSGIEWTEVTWDPVTGCNRVSTGCDHCYALSLAKRPKAMGNAKYQKDGDPAPQGRPLTSPSTRVAAGTKFDGLATRPSLSTP